MLQQVSSGSWTSFTTETQIPQILTPIIAPAQKTSSNITLDVHLDVHLGERVPCLDLVKD